MSVRPDLETFDLIWPAGLAIPARPPRLLYLDLNHWIGLAQARQGRPHGARYRTLLDACHRAVDDGRIRIVLGSELAEEISAIADPRQRNDLAAVVGELTSFEYLTGLPEIMRLELNTVLNHTTGTQGLAYPRIDLVGRSQLNAWGFKGGLRVRNADGSDITEAVVAEGGADWLRDLEHKAEVMLLAGPSDEDIPELRAGGYCPEVARESLMNNLLIEQDFSTNVLDDRWRKGRLRDVMGARELALELVDIVTEELTSRGLTLNEVMGGSLEQARRFPLSMPSTCVRIEVKTRYHRDARHRWTVNDLHDIFAMSVAVPYCDIVFTDASIRSALLAAHLDVRMGTIIPRRIEELVEVLDSPIGDDGAA